MVTMIVRPRKLSAKTEAITTRVRPTARLRNDSYLGTIHRENLFVRAGLQNVLQVFITQASNIRRHARETGTLDLGDQLLRTVANNIVGIPRKIIEAKASGNDRRETHTGNLSDPHSHLGQSEPELRHSHATVESVSQGFDLADTVRGAFSRVGYIVSQKTVEKLTRVLVRHICNEDLNDLPLDRPSEKKSRKRLPSGVDRQHSVVSSRKRRPRNKGTRQRWRRFFREWSYTVRVSSWRPSRMSHP